MCPASCQHRVPSFCPQCRAQRWLWVHLATTLGHAVGSWISLPCFSGAPVYLGFRAHPVAMAESPRSAHSRALLSLLPGKQRCQKPGAFQVAQGSFAEGACWRRAEAFQLRNAPRPITPTHAPPVPTSTPCAASGGLRGLHVGMPGAGIAPSALAVLLQGVTLTFPTNSARGQQMVPHLSKQLPSCALSALGLSPLPHSSFHNGLQRGSDLGSANALLFPLPFSSLFSSSQFPVLFLSHSPGTAPGEPPVLPSPGEALLPSLCPSLPGR